MVRSGLECLKILIQTFLKMKIDLRIHQTTENCEQATGSHVLDVFLGAKNLLVKNYLPEGCR